MSQPLAPTLPAASLALCSEQDVIRLVRDFYARVRQDDCLGPVFDARIHDWDAHQAQLVDFWSAMLRGTRRFNGNPMSRHMAMPELERALFDRWLLLFRQTTAGLGNRPMQQLADDVATRIADTFWRRIQMQRWPELPLAGRPRLD